jgi:hypothetical protein
MLVQQMTVGLPAISSPPPLAMPTTRPMQTQSSGILTRLQGQRTRRSHLHGSPRLTKLQQGRQPPPADQGRPLKRMQHLSHRPQLGACSCFLSMCPLSMVTAGGGSRIRPQQQLQDVQPAAVPLLMPHPNHLSMLLHSQNANVYQLCAGHSSASTSQLGPCKATRCSSSWSGACCRQLPPSTAFSRWVLWGHAMLDRTAEQHTMPWYVN